jgi:DNA-binding beta-propeller fold protein YncE
MRPSSLLRALLVCSVVFALVLSSQPSVLGAAGSPLVLRSASASLTSALMAGGQRTPGAELWVARYNGPGNMQDDASAIEASPDGAKVFVTGSSTVSPGNSDYDTVAYDASTGAILWETRYDGPGHSADGASSLGLSPDGTKVFVTGGSIGGSSNYDYATVAYDASTGSMLWVARYDGPGNDVDLAKSLGVSPDGTKVFVTGESDGPEVCPPGPPCPHYATVAYDASSGATLWIERLAGTFRGHDVPSSLAVSPDGKSVFVTGGSLQPLIYHYLTIAYDALSGEQLWLRYFSRNRHWNAYATALVVSPDGASLFVTGGSFGGAGSDYDYATVAYDASTGAQLWVSIYTRPVGGPDLARSLAVSPDGTAVFVTGFGIATPGNVDYDYETVAYEARSGAQLWVKHYDAGMGSEDFGWRLKVSPDGATVFVTGSTGGDFGGDYATVAYDASTGAQLWATRYEGSGAFATSLTVSPDGTKVFVTGQSSGPNDFDYVTVAYTTM